MNDLRKDFSKILEIKVIKSRDTRIFGKEPKKIF